MQTGTVGRSASDAGMSAQTGAEAQQGALPDLPEVGRPALERVSSSAKRQADSSWADSQSPHKRQEVDQSPEHAAAGPASQAVASDRDADDSMMTDAGGEPASGRLTAEGQGADSGSADAQLALAQNDDAASNSSGGFMSYIPGTHANRASMPGRHRTPTWATVLLLGLLATSLAGPQLGGWPATCQAAPPLAVWLTTPCPGLSRALLITVNTPGHKHLQPVLKPVGGLPATYQALKPTRHHRVNLHLSLLPASLSNITKLWAVRLTSKAQTVTGALPPVTAASRALAAAVAAAAAAVVVVAS